MYHHVPGLPALQILRRRDGTSSHARPTGEAWNEEGARQPGNTSETQVLRYTHIKSHDVKGRSRKALA